MDQNDRRHPLDLDGAVFLRLIRLKHQMNGKYVNKPTPRNIVFEPTRGFAHARGQRVAEKKKKKGGERQILATKLDLVRDEGRRNEWEVLGLGC